MNSFISNLDEIFDSRFKLSNSGGVIKLVESNKSAKCKNVSLQISQKVTAISLDRELRGCQVFPFFNPHNKFVNKKADGIIFVELKDKLVVLLIDLKSDNPISAIKQLKVSENIANYFISQAKIKNPNFEKEIIFKQIVFTTKINKGTTKREGKLKTFACNREYKLYQLYE